MPSNLPQDKSQSSMPDSFFEQEYLNDTAAWDLDQVQAAFLSRFKLLEVPNRILDIGCGTGVLARALHEQGHTVVGIDFSKTAIEKAQEFNSSSLSFIEMSVLDLHQLQDNFDCVMDSGLLHTLSDADQERLVEQLKLVLKPGAEYWMLAFAKEFSALDAPRCITEQRLRELFSHGFEFVEVASEQFATRRAPQALPAIFIRVKFKGVE